MERKLVVMIPGFPEKLRELIREKAESLGVDTVFAESPEKALPELKEAEIILGQDSRLPALAPKLRWICTPSAGIDHFQRPGVIRNPEVVLTNSSGAYGVTISEHVVMVTLEMMRRKAEYNRIVGERKWTRDLRIRSIRGSRITLAGTGDIGRECARRLRAFAPACLTGVNRHGGNPEGLFDRVITTDGLDAVLPETDLLILSLPATEKTRNLLDAGRLALLPPTAWIVNVGRGNVLDQKALEQMLRDGKLAGAALDVFAEEPIPAEDSLWDCPGLLITPHIAGNMTLDYTTEKITEQFLEDLENYCAGRPLRHRADFRTE